MNNKKRIVLPVIAVLLLVVIVIVTVLVRKYRPNSAQMDLNKYYQVGDHQIEVILQDKACETLGLYEDGEVYVDINLIQDSLNSRFYWDAKENLLLYTTSTSVISTSTGSKDYYTNKSKASMDYAIVKVEGDQVYVALDYIKEYTALDYTTYDNPNRVVINHLYGKAANYAKTKAKAVIRYQASIKSEILVKPEKDTAVLVLEQEDTETGFCKVMTVDGITGFIKAKDLGTVYQETKTIDFKEETYSHILMDEKVNLVWHQVTNRSANEGILNLLSSTKGVNVISPTWFMVSGNKGEITSLADDTYVSRAHSNGVQVWGLCNDFSNDSKIGKVLSKTTNRQKLEKNLIAEAIRYSLDGINIDFEYVKKENGNDFIQFIRELGIMCRNNGVILSIDNYPYADYNAFYNREEQAKVADYVITMAYDEYYAGCEEAGPVSSLSYVKNSTENVLKEVPAEQAVIALPFYSRLWKETTKLGETKVTAESYGMNGASGILSSEGAKVAWDDATGMNYGEYKKGKALYKMWVEDSKSLEEKMKVATASKVGGLAFWKLGLEDSSVWDSIIKYTN